MAQPMEYVEHLSREIGARPAGTEEEQQAALYIADEFKKETGFATSVEEFTSSADLEGFRAIMAMITIVVCILAMLFNILTGPALVLAVISAVIYALEAFDRPVLSKRLARGASQNVVAKYQPLGESAEGKRGARKIVLLAHYDTGKVTPKIVQRVEGLGLPLGTAVLVGMIAAAFLLVLRLFVGGTGGAGLVFINALTIVAIILVALPIVKAILYRTAPYNEGANNNATGVAALLEVARRISEGGLDEDGLANVEGVTVHGQEALLASGLVPEGVQVTYEAQPTDPADFELDENATEEERLLAAKAAIAALTGQYVEQRVYAVPTGEQEAAAGAAERGDAARNDAASAPRPQAALADVVPSIVNVPHIVNVPEIEVADAGAEGASDAAQAAGLAVATPTIELGAALGQVAAAPAPSLTAGFQNAPSWFVAAQKNAKRSASSEPVQRSRYTEAISAAEHELAERQRNRELEERDRRLIEQREREEAARAALEAQLQAPAAAPSAEPAPEPIEFAPIDVTTYEEPAAIELEPISEEVEGATVTPAQVGAERADQANDPAKTIAFIPEHLRALFHRGEEGDASDPDDVPEPVQDAFDAASPEHSVDAAEDEVVPANGEEAPASEDAMPDAEPDAEAAEGDSAPADEALEGDSSEGTQLDPDVADELEAVESAVQLDEVPAAPAASVRSRLGGLPTIDSKSQDAQGTVPENTNPSRSGLFRMLRTDVPSLSGVIRQGDVEDDGATSQSDGEAPAAKKRARLTKADLPSLTGIMAPVSGDQGQDRASRKPLGGLDVPEVGRAAAEAAVDYDTQIPVSNDLVEAAQAAADALDGAVADASDASENAGRTWEGGAFSRVRLGHVNMRSGEEDADVASVEDDADAPETAEADSPAAADAAVDPAEGVATSDAGGEAGAAASDDQALSDEIELIHRFRNPLYDAEIWFVAVGSDTELHDGARAFLDEHKHDLRGAMFVEVESLGLGELSYVAEEGCFRKMKASSRLKRFTRDATEATGIVLGQVKTRADSVTSTIQKAGFQALHLMGVENGAPALKGSADDIVENVDELILEENINYLMELMKQK